ncbi:hypothetical protein MPC1_340006 [Methylocella tundrae]|nr:hypothetical protein MPC1_340006 [Methylocella tundrae]
MRRNASSAPHLWRKPRRYGFEHRHVARLPSSLHARHARLLFSATKAVCAVRCFDEVVLEARLLKGPPHHRSVDLVVIDQENAGQGCHVYSGNSTIFQ